MYARRKWEDEWTLQAGVYCDLFTYSAGPNVSEAILRYNYGHVLPANSVTPETRTRKSLNGWYVKVELDQITTDDPEAAPKVWVGVVVHTSDERHGRFVLEPPEQIATGQQTFSCRGLEFLLQRTTVDSSFAIQYNGYEYEIGRAIGFNLGAGRLDDHARKGNMSLGGVKGAPVFGFDIGGETTIWNAYNIVNYLFTYHPPADVSGHDKLHWSIGDETDAKILSALKPTVQAQGKTVKQLLDEIIDRRRLVGYTITFIGTGETITPRLKVFTFNKSEFTLPGVDGDEDETTIPANANQKTWYFDDDLAIQSAVVSEDDATRFDRVIARGSPVAACFTIGVRGRENGATISFGDTLEPDWDESLQNEYNEGAKNSSGYSALEHYEKSEAHELYRRQPKFEKVYRYFRLSANFSGVWWPGLKLKNTLPLLTDHDYEEVDSADITNLTIANSQPEYLRPFAVVLVGDKYYEASRMPVAGIQSNSVKTGGMSWSINLRMQDDLPGVILDVVGAPQHVIASEEFTPADDADDIPAEVTWREILVTVCAETDEHAEAKWPDTPLTTDADIIRELIIDVPNARLDWLAWRTVVGINDDGELRRTLSEGWVRDDRKLLAHIARTAYEWYRQTRKSLNVTQHDLVTQFEIGDLITLIGTSGDPEEINSVITHMAFDLRAGTVTIQTQYGELDLHGKVI